MTETTMPVAEVTGSVDERYDYEFAFHVLPTATEGEVTATYEAIKAHIEKVGEITIFEAPERIDLAYPVVKSIDAKNRKFTSSYFGWIRFKVESDKIEDLVEEIDSMSMVLRHLLVKLTKAEVIQPYFFHENRKKVKMVEVVDEVSETISEHQTEAEEKVDVSEEALDESLEKLTKDGEEEKV